jgi:hypothetical protein
MISYLVSNNRELYEAKRRAYHNESLDDLATKTLKKKKIVQYGDELVQHTTVLPRPHTTASARFRSHFLAPRKHFLGMYFDTFWFNIVVNWIMTVLLYITLYYNR